MQRFLDHYLNRGILQRWQKVAEQAENASLPMLRGQRDQARRLRVHLERLIRVADGRLRYQQSGPAHFPKPLGTDWAWRPELWRMPMTVPGLASVPRKAQLDERIAMFHDCQLAEISLRQIRNFDDNDLAPFGLAVDTFEFRGTFLSISVELPDAAAAGLTRQHVVRAGVTARHEHPAGLFARLNIQHGPNTEQVLREIQPDRTVAVVDFDLAHLDLNEKRVTKIWLDLILQAPRLNRVLLRDLTLCRYHRADL